MWRPGRAAKIAPMRLAILAVGRMGSRIRRIVRYLRAAGVRTAVARLRNYGLRAFFLTFWPIRRDRIAVCERGLQSFPVATDLPIGPDPGDCLHLLAETISDGNYAECPGGGMPDANFVLHLADAHLFAAPVLRSLWGKADKLPHQMRHGAGNLVLTQNHELLAESLTHRIVVPDRLRPLAPGSWHADLPRRRSYENRPHVLIDLCSAHFGHVLLDLPARLWIMTEPSLFAEPPALVGFRAHGLGKEPAGWPGYLTEMLRALDVPPQDIWFPDGAVTFRSLYIPRRISPFGPGGIGAPYFRTMRQIGDRIAGDAVGTADRVYLSRRNLRGDPRRILDDGEAQVEALFAARGFAIIHPQRHSLAEQISILRGARHLAGPVGSQLHLAVFCTTPGVRLFRIVPSFFNHDVDDKIMAGVGGSVRTHVVPAVPKPGHAQSLSPWRLGPLEADQMARAVDDWLNAAP